MELGLLSLRGNPVLLEHLAGAIMELNALMEELNPHAEIRTPTESKSSIV